MNARKVITPVLVLSGAVSAVTGMMLFFNIPLPDPLDCFHEWGSIVFLLAIIAHAIINYRLMRQGTRRLVLLGFFGVCVAIILAAWGLRIHGAEVDRHSEETTASQISDALLVRADWSTLARLSGSDFADLRKKLAARGIPDVPPEETLEETARKHGVPANQLLDQVVLACKGKKSDAGK